MNVVKLIAVFAENKPGETARITRLLAEARINIRWVTIATSGQFGVMKLLVDQFDQALQCVKQAGVTASVLEALAVEVTDQPGALHTVADLLARSHVNVDNISGFVVQQRAILVVEVRDSTKASAALTKHRLRLLSQQEMLSL